jgi:MiaB-like tRNA modifying enzyme
VFVEVFGCSSNLADSEMISGIIQNAGFLLVDKPNNADVNIVLTCTVKTPTERKVIKRLNQLSNLDKPLIVAGCMPKAQSTLVANITPKASMIGPNSMHEIIEVLEAALRGVRVEMVNDNLVDKTCLPRVRANPVVHIAPISSGCSGECSYCIVRKARGRLHSFPLVNIIEDSETALQEGCREIWLTAEDTAAYNWKGNRLPQLLGSLSTLNGEFFIRVGMMTPNEALFILDGLIEAYSSRKVFKFLHLPVQSGNNEILRRMNRRYTIEDFLDVVETFRNTFPRLTLSTDIICGFPGETKNQFEDSLKLVERVEPEILNISRFWPRPGTKAARLEGQIHGRTTKERSRRLTKLFKRISLGRSKRWTGWKGSALIDERGKYGGVVGRNYSYKPIVLNSDIPLGEFIDVEVTEAHGGYLIGQIR